MIADDRGFLLAIVLFLHALSLRTHLRQNISLRALMFRMTPSCHFTHTLTF